MAKLENTGISSPQIHLIGEHTNKLRCGTIRGPGAQVTEKAEHATCVGCMETVATRRLWLRRGLFPAVRTPAAA